MLQHHVCPKCQHNHVLVIAAVPDSDETGYQDLRIAKVLAANGFWGPRFAAIGKLSAVVCRACGYTELYTLGAAQIPVDGEWVRELVGPEPSGPYR
ncbi:MAG: hypothetical protein ACM31C_06600 [Acidobacteriota bacterium]